MVVVCVCVCVLPLAGKEKVFEVIVRSETNVYQAGSSLLFLRVAQGSAVITTKTQNGE